MTKALEMENTLICGPTQVTMWRDASGHVAQLASPGLAQSLVHVPISKYTVFKIFMTHNSIHIDAFCIPTETKCTCTNACLG